MTERGHLLAVHCDGSTNVIPNKYEAIRDACGGSIDFAPCNEMLGFFVHDEGVLLGQPLNVVASIIGGRPLFGSAVAAHREPDDDGDTQPPTDMVRKAIEAAARAWTSVLDGAKQMGQDLTVRATPDTLPPPQIIELPDNWSPGDPIPGVTG